jgi:poly(ADP-ribose) glycohydrolase ARH3
MGPDGERLRDRYRGAMLGTLVGDAFGARFEGWDIVERADVDRWLAATDPLRFTDDTHMTIGLAESLLARDGFDGAHMVDTFARHFHAEPWRGYGPGPPQIFAAVERGVPWDQAAASMFGGTGSFGNGSAMRAAPAALFGYPDLAAVASLARQTSNTTHTHLLGIEGAVLQAVGVALALAEPADKPLDVDRFLARLGPELTAPSYQAKLTDIQDLLPNAEPSAVVARLGHGVAAQSSVPTALYAFLRSPDSFVETICFAVALGGDTDTIAAMAGGLAGAYLGEQGIPAALLDRTEAVEEVRGLADQFFARAAPA